MKGTCLRYMMNPQSSSEGRVSRYVRYVMSRNRQIIAGYDEPESPNEAVFSCRSCGNQAGLEQAWSQGEGGGQHHCHSNASELAC